MRYRQNESRDAQLIVRLAGRRKRDTTPRPPESLAPITLAANHHALSQISVLACRYSERRMMER